MKRFVRLVTLLICAAMLVASLPLVSFADDDDPLDPEDILGVVVWHDNEDGDNIPLSGTVVEYDGEACVLTWGIISESDDEYVFYNKHFDGATLKIKYTAPDNSFVLLSLPSSTNVKYLLALNSNEPEENDTVSVYYMDFSGIEKVGELGNSTLEEEYATIESVRGGSFTFDSETVADTSGGLIVCDGYAVGIMTPDSDGNSFVFDTGTSMKSISETLGLEEPSSKRSGSSGSSGSSGTDNKPSKKNDVWLILLFVAIGIALVGLIIYVVVNKNKTKNQPVQQFQPVPPPSYPDQMPNGYPEQQNVFPGQQSAYPIQQPAYPEQQNEYPVQQDYNAGLNNNGTPVQYAPYADQKNLYPDNHDVFVAPQQNPQPGFDDSMDKTVPLDAAPHFQEEDIQNTRICIQSKGGVFDGKKFELQGELFLGRQPGRCQICYPADTGGISGLHCQLRKAGNALELTDLGSSYGTFTKEGKLTPNVPVLLHPGDSFWLADPENTFIVYR